MIPHLSNPSARMAVAISKSAGGAKLPKLQGYPSPHSLGTSSIKSSFGKVNSIPSAIRQRGRKMRLLRRPSLAKTGSVKLKLNTSGPSVSFHPPVGLPT